MSSVGERIDSDESFHSQIIDAFKECARERSWRTSCAMQRNKMPNVGAVSLLSDRLIKRCHYYPTKDIKDEIANVCVSSGATYNVVLHDGSPDTLLAVNVTVILVFPYEKQNGYRRFEDLSEIGQSLRLVQDRIRIARFRLRLRALRPPGRKREHPYRRAARPRYRRARQESDQPAPRPRLLHQRPRYAAALRQVDRDRGHPRRGRHPLPGFLRRIEQRALMLEPRQRAQGDRLCAGG